VGRNIQPNYCRRAGRLTGIRQNLATELRFRPNFLQFPAIRSRTDRLPTDWVRFGGPAAGRAPAGGSRRGRTWPASKHARKRAARAAGGGGREADGRRERRAGVLLWLEEEGGEQKRNIPGKKKNMLIYSLFIRVLFSDSTFLTRKYKFGSLYLSFKDRRFTGCR
jgi:hypothetical protein